MFVVELLATEQSRGFESHVYYVDFPSGKDPSQSPYVSYSVLIYLLCSN
jgi:hypothetical protein